MKKIYKLFFSLVSLMSLCACKKNNDDNSNTWAIERKNGIKEVYKDLTYDELNTMISSSQSFLLSTYDDTCLCSTDFYSVILNPIIEEYEIVTYKIKDTEFAKTTNLDFTPSTPTLVIYRDGQIVSHINAYEKWENNKNNINKVKDYIKEYFYLESPLIDITIDELQTKIDTNLTFLVYFARNSCIDCRTFSSLYLNSWLINKGNKDKTIYCIETTEFYKEDVYQEYKEKYGFSYVPTLQYYVDGTLNDSLTIFNENYEELGYASRYDYYQGKVNEFSVLFESMINKKYSSNN